MLFFASPSSGSRKGGVAFGRFVKLFGNFATFELAIADAFKIAKGFFPVRELAPPTKLLLPLVLVVDEIPLDYGVDFVDWF